MKHGEEWSKQYVIIINMINIKSYCQQTIEYPSECTASGVLVSYSWMTCGHVLPQTAQTAQIWHVKTEMLQVWSTVWYPVLKHAKVAAAANVCTCHKYPSYTACIQRWSPRHALGRQVVVYCNATINHIRCIIYRTQKMLPCRCLRRKRSYFSQVKNTHWEWITSKNKRILSKLCWTK